MIRRALGIGALALALATGVAAAAQPPGPRLAVVKHLWKPPRFVLITVSPGGGAPVRLAGGQPVGESPLDTLLLAPLSWRPDGTEVAFSGLLTIVLVHADGSGAWMPNVAGAESPVFAPDGHTIAFAREGGEQGEIWTVDLATGEQRQLTPSRRGLWYIPTSFSPDGTTLLTTRYDARRSGYAEAVALHLDGGGATRLLAHAREPTYSPDGSKISFFRGTGGKPTDLFVLDVASGVQRRLTHTPHNEELFASWDPSSERIAFTRFRGRHYEWSNSIVEINADGSCETVVLAQRRRTLFYAPAWQPGPGRAAGRIDC